MKNYKLKIIIFFGIISAILLLPKISLATINLSSGYWSSTLNCPDWTQVVGWPTYNFCDGLDSGGDHASGEGHVESVTASANNPSGSGGKGILHWASPSRYAQSSGFKLGFVSDPSELWVRMYVSYQPGFQWGITGFSAECKCIYTFPSSGGGTIWNFAWGNRAGFQSQCCNNPNWLGTAGIGWPVMHSSGISDGSWHYVEIHLKMDTNGADGIAEYWIDGVNGLSMTGLDFDTRGVWHHIEFFGNCLAANIPSEYWVHIDDMAIATPAWAGPWQYDAQGRKMIGLLTGGSPFDTTPPAAPSGVTVQ